MQGQEGEHGIPRSTARYFAGIRAEPDAALRRFQPSTLYEFLWGCFF